MGVTGLLPAWKMLAGRPEGTDCIVDETVQIFVHGVSENRSVVVHEILPAIHKLKVLEEWHIDELLERLHAPTDKFFRNDCARIMYILCDYKNVPKRKAKTQAKRNAVFQKSGGKPYESYLEFTRRGVLDTRSGVVNEMVDPSRLAHTSHMRHQLTEVLLQYFREFVYPPSAYIFFDSCERRGVRVINGSACVVVPDLVDCAAEGEVRAIRRVLQVIASFPEVISVDGADDVPTRIAVCTVDTDAIPLMVEHLWDVNCHDIVLINEAGRYIAIDRFIAFLKEHGWTWQMFKGGCACSGTDYTYKEKYTYGIGGHIAWQAWHAAAGHLSDAHRVNRDVLLEELLCVAYAAKISGATTQNVASVRKVRHLVGSKRKRLERFPLYENSGLYVDGKEDFDWLWDYWGSLGENTGDNGRHAFASAPAPAAAEMRVPAAVAANTVVAAERERRRSQAQPQVPSSAARSDKDEKVPAQFYMHDDLPDRDDDLGDPANDVELIQDNADLLPAEPFDDEFPKVVEGDSVDVPASAAATVTAGGGVVEPLQKKRRMDYKAYLDELD